MHCWSEIMYVALPHSDLTFWYIRSFLVLADCLLMGSVSWRLFFPQGSGQFEYSLHAVKSQSVHHGDHQGHPHPQLPALLPGTGKFRALPAHRGFCSFSFTTIAPLHSLVHTPALSKSSTSICWMKDCLSIKCLSPAQTSPLSLRLTYSTICFVSLPEWPTSVLKCNKYKTLDPWPQNLSFLSSSHLSKW